jgi:flagellar motor component MotA
MTGQILSAVIIIGGGVAVAMGWLTFDDIKSFVKLWNSTQ